MLEEMVSKIVNNTGLSKRDVMSKIEEKKLELSGLISDEGAAYIVAKELGIEMIRDQERLKIANVVPGMQNVDIVGRVTKLGAVREFQTEHSKGRVGSIFIADETGSLRISLFNRELEKIEGIAQGDVVRVRGFVKEDNLGKPEIRMGKFGLIQKTEETIDAVESYRRTYERTRITDLVEGQTKEVRAAILQIFESKPLYEICPECGARLKEDDDYKCQEHGSVESDYGIFVSGIIDDSTGNIRVVFFGANAEKILGIKKADAINHLRRGKIKNIFANAKIGEEFVFEGTVRRNNFFGRIEFYVNNIKDVNVQEEIGKLLC